MPQVVLENGCCDDEVKVQLYEARPGDPAVPQGKAFATISSEDLGLPPHGEASCEAPSHALVPTRRLIFSPPNLDEHLRNGASDIRHAQIQNELENQGWGARNNTRSTDR